MGGRATPQLLYFCSYVTNNIFLTFFGVLVGPWAPTQKPDNNINFRCLGGTIPDAAYQICGCFFLPKTCFLERFVTNLFNKKKIDQKVQKKKLFTGVLTGGGGGGGGGRIRDQG